MNLPEALQLFIQCLLLSLLTVGGYATVLPELQRLLVREHALLSDAGFAQAVAMGQAAPGPNILVVGVVGWVAGGWLGLLACLIGILLPSTLLVWRFARWSQANRQHRGLRAFQVGAAPLVLGLSAASGWLLALPFIDGFGTAWLLLALVAVGVVLRPAWPPLLWLLLGAVFGSLGWV